MRLTLRTLLAYIDNILATPQREELEAQIEATDGAGELIHRTQDTIRRLRLTAPQPLGAGVGFDPNSVSEYLDNTMSPEEVSQLERICLESDMHLAEVASCHHILTMVLGTPADIDPVTKQHVYQLGTATTAPPTQETIEPSTEQTIRIEGAHTPAPPRESNPTPTAPPETTRLTPANAGTSLRIDSPEAVQEVPEYLRAADQQRSRQAILAVAGGGLIVIAAILFLQRDRFIASVSTADANGDQAESSLPPAGGRPETETSQLPVADEVANQNAKEEGDSSPIVGSSASPEAGETSSPPAETAASVAEEDETIPGETDVPDRALDSSDADASGNALLTSDSEEAMALTGDRSLPPRERVTPDPPKDSSTRYREAPTETGEVAEEDPLAPLAELPRDVGTYWEDRTVLLRRSAGDANWFRVASPTPVEADDELLSLPAFHPNVALRAGVGMAMSGATRVALGQTRELPDGFEKFAISGVPTLRIDFGRVVLVNTSGEPTLAGVSVAGNSYFVALEPAVTVAFEIRKAFAVGKDPVDDPSPLEAMAYAPQGNVTWYQGDAPQIIAEPSQWSISNPTSVDIRPYLQPIDWLENEPTNRLEEMAAGIIRESLPPGDSANTAILELQQGTSRKEVKSLAARSAIYVGEFSPILDTLRDSDQRSNWGEQIEALRNAIALSPDSADAVYQTLKRERGMPAADDLMEMLRGYQIDDIGTNPAEQLAGALPKLIAHLESQSLDYRVLAAYNLRQITKKNFLDNPAGSPSDRRRGIQLWRQRLENNQLPPVGLQ